jgi:DnaJ-class molecular chaperone
LLPSAPPEVIRAAYKAMATKNHPDKGGDMVAMQQINRAYAQLTR